MLVLESSLSGSYGPSSKLESVTEFLKLWLQNQENDLISEEKKFQICSDSNGEFVLLLII